MSFHGWDFSDKDKTAESLLELRRLAIRGDARVTTWEIDGTGKLRLAITLPGSGSMRPREQRR